MAHNRSRLLVIHCDDQLAAIVTYRLQLLGYDVETSETIPDAWNTATTFRPHGILLDVDGSRFEAFDLIEQLSSDVDTADVPVMAMSSDADLDLVEKVWRAGAVAFLVTPFDPEVLEQKVDDMLQAAKSSMTYAAHTQSSEPVEVAAVIS